MTLPIHTVIECLAKPDSYQQLYSWIVKWQSTVIPYRGHTVHRLEFSPVVDYLLPRVEIVFSVRAHTDDGRWNPHGKATRFGSWEIKHTDWILNGVIHGLRGENDQIQSPIATVSSCEWLAESVTDQIMKDWPEEAIKAYQGILDAEKQLCSVVKPYLIPQELAGCVVMAKARW